MINGSGRPETGTVMLIASAAESFGLIGLPIGKTVVSRIGRSHEELIDAIAKKDTEAMRVLYLRHSTTIFRFVMRLTKDSSLTEDLVSTVFLVAWRSAGSFKANSAVSTWLLAIARNRTWSALRARRETQLDDACAATVEDAADNPEVTADKTGRAAIVQECLKTLSPAHRKVVDLIYYQEKSVEDAAEILGVPPATVKTRAFHARRRIAERLKDHGIEHAVWS